MFPNGAACPSRPISGPTKCNLCVTKPWNEPSGQSWYFLTCSRVHSWRFHLTDPRSQEWSISFTVSERYCNSNVYILFLTLSFKSWGNRKQEIQHTLSIKVGLKNQISLRSGRNHRGVTDSSSTAWFSRIYVGGSKSPEGSTQLTDRTTGSVNGI